MAWNRNNQVIQIKTDLEFIRVVWLPVPKPSTVSLERPLPVPDPDLPVCLTCKSVGKKANNNLNMLEKDAKKVNFG